MSFVRESVIVGGRPLTFETGRLAKQAHGSVLITFGESVVLVTAVSNDERPGIDFFPLTCEYVEKTFAAGKIPGGFFKREGRLARRRDPHLSHHRPPAAPAVPRWLPQRHAGHRDRAVRATRSTPPTCSRSPAPALRCTSPTSPGTGPSSASALPASKASSSPTRPSSSKRRRTSTWSSPSRSDAIVMVEGGAAEASENDVVDALMFAHRAAQPILDLIEKMRAAVGKPKRAFTLRRRCPRS